MENFVLVVLGIGLGSVFYINGKIVEGGYGLASELGYIIVVLDGWKCFCGCYGCLEIYVFVMGLCRIC